MISWVDITPTILDYAGVKTPEYEPHVAYRLLREPDGRAATVCTERSFLGNPGGDPSAEGWDEIYASHTFHEIQMYYPMRAGADAPLQTDLEPGPSTGLSPSPRTCGWQRPGSTPFTAGNERCLRSPIGWRVYPSARVRTLRCRCGPLGVQQPGGESGSRPQALEDLKEKLREFQKRTADPWLLKWHYE